MLNQIRLSQSAQMRFLPLFPLLLSLSFQPVSAAPRFEFKEGETVVFLGDSFIEREQYHGWIELASTTQFPDRNITFKNLGWSADTPAGDSRNGLSLLQAGRAPEGEGWRQLVKQLSEYQPDVIVLGYGMAASLEGGSEPAEFKENLNRLIDEAPKATGKKTRFIILGTPPRFPQPYDLPGELDDARKSLAAFNGVLSETAEKRGITFVSLADLEQDPAFTQDGIHLTDAGYKAVARLIEKSLNWEAKSWDKGRQAEILRQHIIRKNEWFFNRSRPANMAYIFGFRKREQGRNAKEIPQFDALITEEEEAIAKMRDLSTGTIVPLKKERTASKFANNTDQPHPEFTVAEGYEVNLWAENPLLHKPTQMNFDPQGRLWVASSESYPQVEVGQTPDDKVIILEDTTGDGKADKSTVFAGGMMMPTAVLPGDGGAYVAQSTDLLHFKDTDGDGKADVKTRVLSGFGTEDTHHNLHTLRRAPDGSIWMNQSIYTRSDVETPHGIVRLKSGGVFRFDPREISLKPTYFGFWNTWGHQFDKYGQSFLTDGAWTAGINWGIPGAVYSGYAGADKVLNGISPGRYPKFCGLEIIESSHFPDDWQGNMITCDFRAHRIVRFSIADQGAGYVTQELDDVLRTDSVNFRPIDVKIGPDGALYVADWSNPIINHGEVDFRDPRRDREHGRIWKITKKNSPLLEFRDFTKLPEPELIDALASENRYDREQAVAVLYESKSPSLRASLEKKTKADAGKIGAIAAARLHLSLFKQEDSGIPLHLEESLKSKLPEIRAAAVRLLVHPNSKVDSGILTPVLKTAVADSFPRVRIEAIRALSTLPGAESMDIALDSLNSERDRFIDYALWLNVQSHGKEWLAAFSDGEFGPTGNETKLNFVLTNLPRAEASAALTSLIPKPLPNNGSGPWLKLGLENGNSEVITAILDQALSSGFDKGTTDSVFQGIANAVSQRQVKPSSDLSKLAPFITRGDNGAIDLAGALADERLFAPLLSTLTSETDLPQQTGEKIISAIGNFRSEMARKALTEIAADGEPKIRRLSALALARNHRAAALPLITSIAAELNDSEQSRSFWQSALSAKGISKQLATAFSENPLSPEMAASTLRHIPDVKEHDALLNVLRSQAGSALVKNHGSESINKMAARAAANGDPNRGELVYRRPALACTACHAIGGAGGKSGPDLTSIGASAPLDYLIESVVNPGAKIKEGYHSIIIETKTGQAIMGQLLRSSGGSSVIRDATGKEITIADSVIAKKTDAGSLMPGNLINSLNRQETDDLFKFLSSLGKPGDFSSNESKAPKIYALISGTPENMAAASQGDPSLPWITVNATVNGRLLQDDLSKVKNGPGGQTVIATKLQLSEPTAVSLTFPEDFKPSDIWIDGKPAKSGKINLNAGIHTLVVSAKNFPDPFRIQSKSGTFLPEW